MGNRNQLFGIYQRPAVQLIAAGLAFCAVTAQPLHILGRSPQQVGAVPLAQGIADLADKLAKGIPEGHPMTVAVTDFPDLGGQTCRLGRYVAERLSTLLSQHPQCHLVERRRLNMVLQELKFSMSELVDPAKARRLGQMLGVQGLVLGTVSDVGGTLDLDARIVDIQTDVSLPGASASIVKDGAVSAMSSDCASAVRPPIGKGPQLPPPPPSSAANSVVAEGITFEVSSCEIAGTSLTCSVGVTNGSREDLEVSFLPYRSRIIDNSGNEYHCQRYRFGSKQAAYYGPFNYPSLDNTLVSGTPTNLVMTFEKVPEEVSKIALLEIGCSLGRRGTGREFAAQMRSIPVTSGDWPRTNKP